MLQRILFSGMQVCCLVVIYQPDAPTCNITGHMHYAVITSHLHYWRSTYFERIRLVMATTFWTKCKTDVFPQLMCPLLK